MKETISFVKTAVILIAIAIFLRGSVVEAYKIPSSSMKPTLMIGDHIFVSKFNFGFRLPFVKNTIWQYSAPERGDIVVFTRPDDPTTEGDDESKMNIIKRVIGVEGDTVEVRDTELYLNGKKFEEPYQVWWLNGGVGNFGPVKVPEGHVFLLGDNRDHSKDSRFWNPSPFLPISLVKGKALIIYWSFDSLSRIGGIIR